MIFLQLYNDVLVPNNDQEFAMEDSCLQVVRCDKSQQQENMEEMEINLKEHFEKSYQENLAIKMLQKEEAILIADIKEIGKKVNQLEINAVILQQNNREKKESQRLRMAQFKAKNEFHKQIRQQLHHENKVHKKVMIEVRIQDRELLSMLAQMQQKHCKLQIDKEKTNRQKEIVQKEIEELYMLKKRSNNQLQEERGNIRVYCRIRPFMKKEKDYPVHDVLSNCQLLLTTPSNLVKSMTQENHVFVFQRIFDMQDSQVDVFNQLGQLIQSAVDGKNVCIFAYGQTGSGKTYTMEGMTNDTDMGLIPRSVQQIFKEIQIAKGFSWNYQVLLSIQEVYLDSVRDLLNKENKSHDFTELAVDSPQKIYSLLKDAHDLRKVAETKCNEHSSRSHLIVTIRLIATHAKDPNIIRKGCLNLIDLAGSQRLEKSQVSGERLKETKAINSSLSALGTVISKLATAERSKNQKETHIPFRNSKLTQLLQPFLTGDSKTLMFVNISPSADDFGQTINSLRFAETVREAKVKK